MPAVAGIALVTRLPAVDEVVLEVGQLHSPHVPRGVAHRDGARHPAAPPRLHGRLQAAVPSFVRTWVDRLQPALHRVYVVQPLHLILAVEQPLQGTVRVVVVTPVASSLLRVDSILEVAFLKDLLIQGSTNPNENAVRVESFEKTYLA